MVGRLVNLTTYQTLLTCLVQESSLKLKMVQFILESKDKIWFGLYLRQIVNTNHFVIESKYKCWYPLFLNQTIHIVHVFLFESKEKKMTLLILELNSKYWSILYLNHFLFEFTFESNSKHCSRLYFGKKVKIYLVYNWTKRQTLVLFILASKGKKFSPFIFEANLVYFVISLKVNVDTVYMWIKR